MYISIWNFFANFYATFGTSMVWEITLHNDILTKLYSYSPQIFYGFPNPVVLR